MHFVKKNERYIVVVYVIFDYKPIGLFKNQGLNYNLDGSKWYFDPSKFNTPRLKLN